MQIYQSHGSYGFGQLLRIDDVLVSFAKLWFIVPEISELPLENVGVFFPM